MKEEIEVASVLLVAMSRQGYGHPNAIAKVNYPFKVYKSDEGEMVFDLLELSKAEKKWLLPKDISKILDELESAENSESLVNLFNKGLDELGKESEYGSTWITGMIAQEDVKAYLLCNTLERNSEQELDIFKPVLTKGKFSSMIKKTKSCHKEIEENILSTEKILERVEALHEAIRKNQEKNLSVFKKESEKRLDGFKKEKDAAFKKIEKSLKKETKAINDEIKERLTAKTSAAEVTKEEINSLERRIESGAEGDAKRALADYQKALSRYIKEIEALEGERGKRLSKVENDAESEKQRLEEQLLLKSREEETLLRRLLETHERTLSVCKELVNRISDVKATMTKNAESLSRILHVKYENGRDMSMPFYVFRYGEDSYGFYPPVKVSEERGMRKMLKMIIAGNLGNKIGQFISPQTGVFDGLLGTVVDSLKGENELSDQFSEALQKANLLESREYLDKMIVGLCLILEQAWISDGDYIEVQRFLAEKLDYLNGGNVFQTEDQKLEGPIDSVEAVEVAITG